LSNGSYWAIFGAAQERGSPVTERTRIEDYVGRLYGYAFSLAGNHHQAEDLVQDCAVRALTAKNTPRDERAYRAWLFQILRNAFLDQVRHKKVAVSATDDEKFAPEMEFWQGDERFITVLTVKLEMAKLPQRHREIIALIDLVGLSYAETAQLLGVPAGTVMSRISRARRMLLDAIGLSNVHELPVKNQKGIR
jgi:RNA polymerase sigma-70 factor (ECF subfamily)